MENIKRLSELKKGNIPLMNDVEMICMSNLRMKKVNWLWPDRIACGKLTVIAGNPGLGKSQITAGLAAAVTTGRRWPDKAEAAAIGDVIILSTEDDPEDTILPRLNAAHADISRCHVLNAVRVVNKEGKTGVRTFDLSQDVDRLRVEIEKIGGVRMVIIDPISAYLGKDTDSHNNSDMRGLLAPLSAMAAQHNVAIILVTHFNKSNTQDAIGRVIGSIGLIAAARAGYAVIKDEKDPTTRYFVPIKNNIGNDKDGLAFQIEGKTLQPEGIKTSMVCWQEGLVEAQKVLYPETEKQPTQTNGAKDFLRNILANGPKTANDVFEEAEGAGYKKPTIQRAATALGVKREKTGMDGGWTWRLPIDVSMFRSLIESGQTEDCTDLPEGSTP